jgi:hypothetical protein
MKGKILILVAVCSLIFMSCVREFTCTCVSSLNDDVLATESTTVEGTRGEADDICDEGDGQITILSVTSSTECELE